VDLKRLGLRLDTLKIQNVTDRVGYLESIGRAKNAEILRIASVTEAERTAEARGTEAEARRRAAVDRGERLEVLPAPTRPEPPVTPG
jgi:flotillin